MSIMLLDRYELGQTLGQGTYSKVKLAKDTETNEMVAIKIHKLNDPKFDKEKQNDLERSIENEVNMILELLDKRNQSHPHIIQLKGYYPEGTVKKLNGKQYKVKCIVIEEYASGGELFFFVQNSGPFQEPQARYLFRQIIDGLEYMHKQGIAHRDIKVDNVLLDADFNVKLADFGYAGPISGRNGDGYMRTNLGTKAYESPQILEKLKYKGKEVDLFAVAVVLFIMVSGTPPFTNAERDEFYYKFIIQKEYDKFWTYHYQDKEGKENFFSADFRDLINHMLNYNPSERLTIEQIKNHSWFKGPTPTYSEMRAELMTRQQKNELEHQRELQKKRSHERRQRFRGGGGASGEDYEDEKQSEATIVLTKEIKEYVDNQLQTKIFYKDSPDLVFEILENYINKKQEDGEEFKFEVSDSAYKAKISAFDSEEKVKFDFSLKAFRVAQEDFFAYQFVKNEGDSILFIEFFDEIQKHLEVKLGYVEEKEDDDQ